PIPRAFRLRTFKREWPRGKPLHPCLMLNSAVRTSKSHQVGPDAGQGRVVNVKLKVDWLSGLTAPSNEIGHRVAPNCKDKERYLPTVFFLRVRMNRAGKAGPYSVRNCGRPPLPLFFIIIVCSMTNKLPQIRCLLRPRI